MTLKKHFEDWVEPRRWSLSLKKLIMHRHMPLQGMCQVQVVFEFDRSEYDAYLFLMNQKKTEEVEQVWNAMSGEPVVADIDLLEEDSQSVKLMMISLAILSVEKKVKG